LFALTSPWIYLAIAALCGLARELVHLVYRQRAIVLLLEKTHDPASLRYLVQLEEARPLIIQRKVGQARPVAAARLPKDGRGYGEPC
jgi:hypothetical protein